MKEYTGDRIRNVAIVGHGGAGTTSVTEALLYRSGAISRMCKVEDGATTTDYEPEEIKRGVSVNATLAPVEWRDTKINFIDTPGFADFVAEVKGAFRAVDSALIVVCATSGVQVGTEQCWKLAEEAHLPRIIFVNKMDREMLILIVSLTTCVLRSVNVYCRCNYLSVRKPISAALSTSTK